MYKAPCALFIIVMIIVVLVYVKKKPSPDNEQSRVRIHGHAYSVNSGSGHEHSRAAMLHAMHMKNDKLVKYLRKHATRDQRMKRLVKKMTTSPPILREVESSINQAGYSENKGDVVAICLSDEKIKMNDLYFVMLHELAHIANSSWGHDSSFWSCFDTLIRYAREAGLYKPTNYEKDPKSICGKLINHQPFSTTDGN